MRRRCWRYLGYLGEPGQTILVIEPSLVMCHCDPLHQHVTKLMFQKKKKKKKLFCEQMCRLNQCQWYKMQKSHLKMWQ